jgi:ankyrin repeat protein
LDLEDPEDGKTLLHRAVELMVWPAYRVGHGKSITWYLLEKGADINARSTSLHGMTPLHYAVSEALHLYDLDGMLHGFAAVEYLLHRGADESVLDAAKRRPRQIAVEADSVIDTGVGFAHEYDLARQRALNEME